MKRYTSVQARGVPRDRRKRSLEGMKKDSCVAHQRPRVRSRENCQNEVEKRRFQRQSGTMVTHLESVNLTKRSGNKALHTPRWCPDSGDYPWVFLLDFGRTRGIPSSNSIFQQKDPDMRRPSPPTDPASPKIVAPCTPGPPSLRLAGERNLVFPESARNEKNIDTRRAGMSHGINNIA
jgi:hypothetical protein